MSSQSEVQDLDNRALTRRLLHTGGLLLVALLLGANARHWYPDTFAPGSPIMQSIAMIGALCLLGAVMGAFSKRFGASARHGFRRHVWLSLLGAVLVAFHSTGALEAPALMLFVLVGLALAGWWGRTHAAVSLSRGFGRKPAMLGRDDPRAALREILHQKVALLRHVEPHAEEATFSLQPAHWLRAPWLSWQFHRAVRQERALLGAHQIYMPADRWWRLAHQLLAWSLVLGIVIHVLLCTFFAGYVADGDPVYWWHLTAWDFG